jgi:hypothetical protein
MVAILLFSLHFPIMHVIEYIDALFKVVNEFSELKKKFTNNGGYSHQDYDYAFAAVHILVADFQS